MLASYLYIGNCNWLIMEWFIKKLLEFKIIIILTRIIVFQCSTSSCWHWSRAFASTFSEIEFLFSRTWSLSATTFTCNIILKEWINASKYIWTSFCNLKNFVNKLFFQSVIDFFLTCNRKVYRRIACYQDKMMVLDLHTRNYMSYRSTFVLVYKYVDPSVVDIRKRK